jgi:magnesium and cobalt exporter, CNNM family
MIANVAWEGLIILVLILANGLLAMAEFAVVSARKARLQQLANRGDEKARAALELATHPADFLSTVQIGITLVGILAGAFGGATIARDIAAGLAKIPWLAPYSSAIGFGIVVVVITYFSLVLGELVPKRVALSRAERIASALAAPMGWLSRLSHPLVRLLSGSSDAVLHLFGLKQAQEPPVTEEEIKVLIDQGTRAGVFAEVEQDMVEAVFRLGDRRVGTLMTPRTQIVWLDLEESVEETKQKIIGSDHARFPVAEGGLDNVVGIVQAKDLLESLLVGKPLDLKAEMIQPLIVPESMPALKVLELFRQSRIHTALVIDEFGGLQGLVTIFDLLESIVGDIPEEGEIVEPEVVQREDGSWLIDGRLPVDEFKEFFHLHNLPEEDRGYYQTVGGFVMSYLGRIPTAADHFEWSQWHFEVVDMDGFRVDKVLLVPLDHGGDEPKVTQG